MGRGVAGGTAETHVNRAGHVKKGTDVNILLIAIGTRGDVQPFVTAGQALIERGHQVSLAAPKGFAAMAEAAGLGFHPLPMDFQELMQEPEIKAAMTTLSGKLKAYRWASDRMNAQMDALWAIGLEVAPDLILHHFKGSLAPYLARRLGAISIPVMLQPGFMATGEYPQFLIASRSLGRVGNLASHHLINAVIRLGGNMMIRRWRKASNPDLGPTMDAMQGYHPGGEACRVHAYSPTLVPRPDAWPASEVQTGYLFADPAEFTPPPALAQFLSAGPSPVYIGFGSMPGIDAAAAGRAVQQALAQTGRRAVVATGWGGLQGLENSDSIHVLDAVPHDWLFPRVSVVVHHGGSGTTHEGLRWGRPSVICPLFADQPFFGQRVADLGAGPPPIAQKKLSAERLAAALMATQVAPVQAKAAEIGAAIRAEDGVGRLCDLVARQVA